MCFLRRKPAHIPYSDGYGGCSLHHEASVTPQEGRGSVGYDNGRGNGVGNDWAAMTGRVLGVGAMRKVQGGSRWHRRR
ncbi:uncharacterized protein B0H18DRAFT_47877 [Fomitopsis serialis]|uniref:uncharacterized protein n=1 Tax=Fomitopsis serialis TaxID=139415 RepID=UPI002007728A|nr:uncharacterized protein B0H18DRAFT_539755 [Neoantrodia serialis]XP_047887986.1 uncharacterized protein B0H18DRAFT_47877 [Neoantrodia serialis]KAH9908826.1 hypothetical protein B0H18DRAFT_539755 [Neoantrodia serialis]KAH9916899.1 hypothetical protein B0H18DRAFT_47877 [Neoantrodia serialis]